MGVEPYTVEYRQMPALNFELSSLEKKIKNVTSLNGQTKSERPINLNTRTHPGKKMEHQMEEKQISINHCSNN